MKATRAVEPEPKQFWMEPKTWVLVQQKYFVGQARCTNITMVFSFRWFLVFNGPNLFGAGAKNF